MCLSMPVHGQLYTNINDVVVRNYSNNKKTIIEKGKGVFLQYLGWLEYIPNVELNISIDKFPNPKVNVSNITENQKDVISIQGNTIEHNGYLIWDYKPFKDNFVLYDSESQSVICDECSGKGYIKAYDQFGAIHSWYRGDSDKVCNCCKGDGYIIETN